jgi:hypothetical protein
VHTEGAEACTRALDTVVKMPEARDLFSESLERFRDVTCIGLCNWANVHLCLAKKLMEHAAENGQSVSDIKKEFDEHCAQATKRYKEALGYNGALPLQALGWAMQDADLIWRIPHMSSYFSAVPRCFPWFAQTPVPCKR